MACVYCDLPRRCCARWTENHPRERGTRDTREKHHRQRKIGACSIILFLTITRLDLQLARIASTALEGVVLTAVEERERRLAVAIEDVTPSRTETNAHQATGGLRPPLPPTASPAVPPPPSTSPAPAAASSSKRAVTARGKQSATALPLLGWRRRHARRSARAARCVRRAVAINSPAHVLGGGGSDGPKLLHRSTQRGISET